MGTDGERKVCFQDAETILGDTAPKSQAMWMCVHVAGAHRFKSAHFTSNMPPAQPSFAPCGSGAGCVQTGRVAPARGFGPGTWVNRDGTGQEEERA